MNIKDLLREDDAVSPVIGVILMVAITVILAAVIGTFVLGLGDQVQSSAPNANFQFEYEDSGDGFGATGDSNADDVIITHNGGQDVTRSNVEVQVGSTSISPLDGTVTGVTDWGDPIETGSSITITDDNTFGTGSTVNFAEGDDVRVVWTSPNGDSSNTIGSSTIPA